MKITVFAYSRRGCDTARRVMRHFNGEELAVYTMARFEEKGFLTLPKPSAPLYEVAFMQSDALIFVGSCGIAVREIAPYIKDKRSDPAVIVIDEVGNFVIPVLSGHIGGANRLAAELAEALGSTPVITTATDINRKFSVDAWAAGQGFCIGSMTRAKEISAAILERPVALQSDLPIGTVLPPGVFECDGGDLGIYIGWQKREPFEKTLCLIPPVLHLGIGCRRNTPAEAIEEAVTFALDLHRIDSRAVKCIASVDLKADEEGILAYGQRLNRPIFFYSAEELNEVIADVTASSFVKGVVGVDNVCERAALIGADKLIVKKMVRNGVTVAVAEEYTEVCFG